MRFTVSDILLVDEAHIERAVNAYLTLQKTMAEGAGAAGLAAMLAEPKRFAGKKVGLVLCGGGALLGRIDHFLHEQTGLPVRITPDPLTAVVRGLLICMEHFQQWRRWLQSGSVSCGI